MPVLVLGLNHRAAFVDDLPKFAIRPDRIARGAAVPGTDILDLIRHGKLMEAKEAA